MERSSDEEVAVPRIFDCFFTGSSRRIERYGAGAGLWRGEGERSENQNVSPRDLVVCTATTSLLSTCFADPLLFQDAPDTPIMIIGVDSA